MAKIAHIALASDNPFQAAEFYKSAFGFRELRRFGFDPARPEHAPRPSGVLLSDGTLNIALLKFGEDQTGVGLDFTGFHHFGIVIEDVDDWTAKLEALGVPCIAGKDAIPPGAHFEIKFRGPGGEVFDISDRPWPGSLTE